MSRQNNIHFAGFSAETVFFLKNLRENNNRDWFLARKKDYEKKVLQPAREFVVEMGHMLQKISPGIQADSRVNRSISRIYQDVSRYASNQEPYKTYLAIYFWQGIRKGGEPPGYYFELRPEQLYLAAGSRSFSRKALHSFREAVANPESGEELVQIIAKIQENKDYQLNKPYYKSIPEGYHIIDSKRVDLIRFNGLLASREMPIPPELYTRDLLKLVYNIYKDWSPLQNWLTKYVYEVPKGKT
jgi:uncharacterized protein (TIGR02453 family)